MVSYDIIKRCRMSKSVKLRGKNSKLKVIELYAANYHCIFWISLIEKCLFLSFSKYFFFLLFKLRYFWSLGFQIIVIYREKKTPSFLNTLNLKVLRNRISRIIRLWSLFCSILVYASLHFLLENIFLSFLPVMCRIWCNLHKLYNICTIFVYIGVT